MASDLKKTVAVDVDGCLARYHGWRGHDKIGTPHKGAVAFTHNLKDEGFRVLIYSTRCKGDAVDDQYDNPLRLREVLQAWLDKHGFYYDEIYIGQGKPMAVAYVDDRAVSCVPAIDNDGSAFNEAIKGCRYLASRPNEPEDYLT